RRHTRSKRDWSSDVCSSDLNHFDFGSPFYQSHNGALMSFALDGVGFKVAEFTVKVGKVDSPLVNALAKLTGLPPPFYVTIGATRSEERRVGKECRAGWSRSQ